MTPKESERNPLDLPKISPKTSYEQLQKWSKGIWESDGIRGVAADIVDNGKELLVDWDWELVLDNIRIQRFTSLQSGVNAIAINGARMIGALAVAAGWSMDDPAIVYLSAKCLANRASSNFENFKRTMREAALAYGQNALPEPHKYMQTLDFLLELRDRNKHRSFINKVALLLGKGNIEEAYTIASSLGDSVRRR